MAQPGSVMLCGAVLSLALWLHSWLPKPHVDQKTGQLFREVRWNLEQFQECVPHATGWVNVPADTVTPCFIIYKNKDRHMHIHTHSHSHPFWREHESRRGGTWGHGGWQWSRNLINIKHNLICKGDKLKKKFECTWLPGGSHCEMASYCVNPAVWHLRTSNLWGQQTRQAVESGRDVVVHRGC